MSLNGDRVAVRGVDETVIYQVSKLIFARLRWREDRERAGGCAVRIVIPAVVVGRIGSRGFEEPDPVEPRPSCGGDPAHGQRAAWRDTARARDERHGFEGIAAPQRCALTVVVRDN